MDCDLCLYYANVSRANDIYIPMEFKLWEIYSTNITHFFVFRFYFVGFYLNEVRWKILDIPKYYTNCLAPIEICYIWKFRNPKTIFCIPARMKIVWLRFSFSSLTFLVYLKDLSSRKNHCIIYHPVCWKGLVFDPCILIGFL